LLIKAKWLNTAC